MTAAIQIVLLLLLAAGTAYALRRDLSRAERRRRHRAEVARAAVAIRGLTAALSETGVAARKAGEAFARFGAAMREGCRSAQ